MTAVDFASLDAHDTRSRADAACTRDTLATVDWTAAQTFDQAVSADEAIRMLRDDLPHHILGIKQCVLLAVMNKPKMAEFFRRMLVNDGEDAVVKFMQDVDDFQSWAAGLGEFATVMQARVLCATAAVACPPEEGCAT